MLIAVHIMDNVLAWPWWVGGGVAAAILVLAAAWRVRDEEIPRIALLTAAFFVASAIPLPIPGPTHVHLLFNGLVGVVLGRRAALAIFVALVMQWFLLGHGGSTTIGINTCVMGLPAYLGWALFAGLQRVPWLHRPWFRSLLVAGSVLTWTLSLIYCIALLCTTHPAEATSLDLSTANHWTFEPLTLLGASLLAGIVVLGERRLENAPEFPLGLAVGELTVLATVVLNCAVLILGGERNWRTWALFELIAHLPIAVLEGVVLGFTVGFLVKVKPEMLGWLPREETACSADPLP